MVSVRTLRSVSLCVFMNGSACVRVCARTRVCMHTLASESKLMPMCPVFMPSQPMYFYALAVNV